MEQQENQKLGHTRATARIPSIINSTHTHAHMHTRTQTAQSVDNTQIICEALLPQMMLNELLLC